MDPYVVFVSIETSSKQTFFSFESQVWKLKIDFINKNCGPNNYYYFCRRNGINIVQQMGLRRIDF